MGTIFVDELTKSLCGFALAFDRLAKARAFDFVGNRAQRCDRHKLAGFGGWRGVWSCVQIMSCGHFGSRTILRANLKDCDVSILRRRLGKPKR